MKRLSRLGILLALAAIAGLGIDFKALKPQGYVSDFQRVVDPRTRAVLERYCKAVEDSTGVQMALVLIPTLGGEPIEDVANLLYRSWGIGRKETDEGILLLLVIQDRRSRLEVGYGLEPYITDGYAGSLLREMRPALRSGDYGDALVLAATALGGKIAAAKGVTIDEAPPRPRRVPDDSGDVPWGSVIGGLVFLVWILGASGRRGGGAGMFNLLAAVLLGRHFGGAFGGRSGGGFGGFDSSDGFGGFGGGDSGGGGASSNW